MTNPRQAAIDEAREKAEILADQICACANREQHRRDVKLITNALLAARVEGLREAAQFMDKYPGTVANGVRVITVNAGQPSNPSVTFGDQLRARADELEAMAKEIDDG